jgi:GAF domain-containing protein
LVARKPLKNKGSRVRDLEKRLAESLEHENATGQILQEKDRALAEALEQQTVTAEILRVISSSPTNLWPVLATIAENAARVCGATDAVVHLVEGGELPLVAHYGLIGGTEGAPVQRFPLTRGSVVGRAVIDARAVHVEDAAASDEAEFPLAREIARQTGHRTVLATPLLREGVAIGALVIRRSEVRPFADKQIALLQTFADQAVIAIENVRLFNETKEALEQQTATSKILGVISSSPTDVQPVFDAIAEQALRLCEAVVCNVCRFDGELVHLAATTNVDPDGITAIRSAFPMRLGPQSAATRTVLTRALVHIPDILDDLEYGITQQSLVSGFRSVLAVPMLRDGSPLGSIVVGRPQPGPFSDRQIALLQTFADQAVIAIENVRLFKELEARNRDLTATSEILRAISSSPTDIQPVFDIIAESAVRLCGAEASTVTRFDGEWVHLVAVYGSSPEGVDAARRAFPRRPSGAAVAARAIRDRAIAHIPDVLVDKEHGIPEVAVASGFRAALAVPILHEGRAIGAIAIGRSEPGEFSERQVELLRTFADQALIAIENVRLFTELQERNRAVTQAHAQVTEALEQQTTTAEILRVISRSQTDVQPVFDTIAESAARLCDAQYCFVYRFEGQLLHFVAHHGLTAEVLEINRRAYPAPPSRRSVAARAVLERSVVQIPDVNADPDYALGAMAEAGGYRSAAAVPILRDGLAIGSIAVTRAQAGLLPERQIELLKTFADQAVIAVENARLFKELQARTGELTQSVEQLTALGEVSRAVSSTLDVETVLDTIVSRASQLAGAAGCSIYEYDEAAEQFELRATHNDDTAFVEALRAVPLRKGEGLMGRAAEMREPIQIPDITQPGAYQSSVRDTLIRFGYRALLAVPLLREDQIIGSLSFNRKAPGEFPPEVVDVLKTFATQSALAIQNARLFREIADKSAQLEAASRHKSEFLANMSHELRTPLNAIIGFSEILAEKMFGDINEKQTEYLQDILESGRHLLSLINDILDLSKVEAGRMELELSEFDLPNAIDNALILVRERASRRGIKLGHIIDERLGMIGGDERKVKQVLLNLLSNALKFTPEGGRIDVGARLDGDVAEVSVADTGIGIAPADQDAVFEEFRQVGTADRKAEGTGLGLTLSRKFIELHGGRIWVKSELGTGSTFTFTLPLTIDQRRP